MQSFRADTTPTLQFSQPIQLSHDLVLASRELLREVLVVVCANNSSNEQAATNEQDSVTSVADGVVRVVLRQIEAVGLTVTAKQPLPSYQLRVWWTHA